MNCLFRFHDGSIKSPQVVEFLKVLRRYLKRKLLPRRKKPAIPSRILKDL